MYEPRLKICDLCGAPNLMENTECHVCGWRGRFHTEPRRVRQVIQIARRLQTYMQPTETVWHTRLREIWGRLQRWYAQRKHSLRFRF